VFNMIGLRAPAVAFPAGYAFQLLPPSFTSPPAPGGSALANVGSTSKDKPQPVTGKPAAAKQLHLVPGKVGRGCRACDTPTPRGHVSTQRRAAPCKRRLACHATPCRHATSRHALQCLRCACCACCALQGPLEDIKQWQLNIEAAEGKHGASHPGVGRAWMALARALHGNPAAAKDAVRRARAVLQQHQVGGAGAQRAGCSGAGCGDAPVPCLGDAPFAFGRHLPRSSL